MRFARLTYAVILLGAALWCGLIVCAPVALAAPRFHPLGTMLYAFFSPLCHQIDSRSFHVFGEPLAVCARCSSIYFGFFLGALAYPAAGRILRGLRAGPLFLLSAVAPMILDVLLEALGLYESSNVLHALTGAWFGVLLPFIIVPGAVEGIAQLTAQHNPHSAQSEKGLVDA